MSAVFCLSLMMHHLCHSIMTVITTQSSTKCPLFGQFQKLDVLTLPTYENVMKAYLWESYSTNKYIKWKNISQIEEI